MGIEAKETPEGEDSVNLYEKLLVIQQNIDKLVKDNQVGEGKQSYKAVSSEQVLEKVRPLLNDLKLLLLPEVDDANVIVGATSSGTARYLTEMHMIMTWVDVESGEKLPQKWYAQGVDLAGEKGVGKGNTYAEKYYFMKAFHVPTPKDDPDGDKKVGSGEKAQRGTQAEAETILYQRESVRQMLAEIYGGDVEKTKAAVVSLTKNNARQYAGVDNVDAITDMQVKVVYGKLKGIYAKRTGKEFVFQPVEKEGAADAD